MGKSLQGVTPGSGRESRAEQTAAPLTPRAPLAQPSQPGLLLAAGGGAGASGAQPGLGAAVPAPVRPRTSEAQPRWDSRSFRLAPGWASQRLWELQEQMQVLKSAASPRRPRGPVLPARARELRPGAQRPRHLPPPQREGGRGAATGCDPWPPGCQQHRETQQKARPKCLVPEEAPGELARSRATSPQKMKGELLSAATVV